MPLTDEGRARLRAAHTGKILSLETRAKMSAAKRGKALSTSHKAKISAAKRGKITAEHKARVSAANKGHPPHAFTSATRQRMSEAQLRRSPFPEELPPELLAAIRADPRPQRHIAKDHNVSGMTIWRIKHYKGRYAMVDVNQLMKEIEALKKTIKHLEEVQRLLLEHLNLEVDITT